MALSNLPGRSPLGAPYRSPLGALMKAVTGDEIVRPLIPNPGKYVVTNARGFIIFMTSYPNNLATWASEVQYFRNNFDTQNCEFTFVNMNSDIDALWPVGATTWITPSTWISMADVGIGDLSVLTDMVDTTRSKITSPPGNVSVRGSQDIGSWGPDPWSTDLIVTWCSAEPNTDGASIVAATDPIRTIRNMINSIG